MIKYLLFCWYVILFLSCCEEERPGYATRELIFPDYRNVNSPTPHILAQSGDMKDKDLSDPRIYIS